MRPSLSSGGVLSRALRSIPLAISAFGAVVSVQLTTAPSKQSTIGLRYTFPAGMENCVTSVSHSLLGRADLKSLRTLFPGCSETSPP